MLTRTSSFDPRPDSYQRFFDDAWASELLKMVEATKLDMPCFDLVHNWNSISNARSLPWLMVACLDSSLEKQLQEAEPLDIYKIHFIRNHLVEYLTKRGISIRPMLQQQIHQALLEVDDRACKSLASAKGKVIERQTSHWEGLLEHQDFTTSLWALERLCYCAVYYNYEAFLTACLRIKRSQPDYSARNDGFKTDFKTAFGPSLQQKCWSDQPVLIARYARHALVHNGGRMTPRLAKQPHPFLVSDGEIQVGAPHTTDLFHDLKQRVTALCKEAVTMTEYQQASVEPASKL